MVFTIRFLSGRMLGRVVFSVSAQLDVSSFTMWNLRTSSSLLGSKRVSSLMISSKALCEGAKTVMFSISFKLIPALYIKVTKVPNPSCRSISVSVLSEEVQNKLIQLDLPSYDYNLSNLCQKLKLCLQHEGLR